MHKTKVSRAVASLETRGWLTRHVDEVDRRIEWLTLTASGAKVYAELAELARSFQKSWPMSSVPMPPPRWTRVSARSKRDFP